MELILSMTILEMTKKINDFIIIMTTPLKFSGSGDTDCRYFTGRGVSGPLLVVQLGYGDTKLEKELYYNQSSPQL